MSLPDRESTETRDEETTDERGRHAERVSDIPPRGFMDVVARVGKDFKDDKVVLISAGVAFFAFISIIPAIAAGVSIYGLIADPSQVVDQAQRFLSALPEDARGLISDQMTDIANQTSSTLGWSAVAAIALALWTASSGTSHLVEAINVAYDQDDERGFFRRRGLALLLTVGFIVFALVFGGLAVFGLNTLYGADVAPWLMTAGAVALWLVVALAMMVVLSVIYRVAPYRDQPKWRWVTWGSVIAVVLWVAASVGFQIYVSNFGSYNSTYGSLGAVIIFFFWLLISAAIVILGAEINAELEHQTGVDTTEGDPRPRGERGAHVADTMGDTREQVREEQ